MSYKGLLVATILMLGFGQEITEAQIIPDNSLRGERSQVRTKNKIQEITGGARRGNNLFHSFEKFSTSQGRGIYFVGDSSVVNIFTRVTGKEATRIDGTLGVRGKANLFLLNPKGIIFGPNAKFKLKGSFIATTGSSFVFGDGGEFSASDPQAPPLLTVNATAPVGIKFGNNPAQILHRGEMGSKLDPGKTLGLFGGEVKIEGGIISSFGGHIRVGAVGNNSEISLIPATDGNYEVSYQGVTKFRDISISSSAEIYSNDSGGSIALQGRNINVFSLAKVYSQNTVNQPGANINLTATGTINITGKYDHNVMFLGRSDKIWTLIYTLSDRGGKGGDITIKTNNLKLAKGGVIRNRALAQGANGNITIEAGNSIKISDPLSFIGSINLDNPVPGNVTIKTQKLVIENGGNLNAVLRGSGKGGNLTITAEDYVKVTGNTFSRTAVAKNNCDYSFCQSNINTNTSLSATGKGGNLTIDTKQLLISEGGFVSTFTQGTAQGGDAEINATESVEVKGIFFERRTYKPSRLSSEVATDGLGNGGSITVNTPRVIVSGGAYLSSSTFGSGKGGNVIINASESVEIKDLFVNDLGEYFPTSVIAQVQDNRSGDGGNITINTKKVTVSHGASLSTSTFGTGDAGSIRINASESVELKDVISRKNPLYYANIIALVASYATGNAGYINLTTDKLTLSDGSFISVARNSKTTGNAGNIDIQAREVFLNNQAKITTDSNGGTGGNLNLKVRDIIFMTQQSQISTNAAETQNLGNGGNIQIESRFIVAPPLQNSNITANAEQGKGGEVNIVTRGLFGIEANSENIDLVNNITASSAQGPQGTVRINIPNVTPNITPLNLSTQPLSFNFVRLCESNNKIQSVQLYYIGRGGEMPTPDTFLVQDSLINFWIDSTPLVSEQDLDNHVPRFSQERFSLFLPCE